MVMDIEGIDDAQSPVGGRQLRKRMSKMEFKKKNDASGHLEKVCSLLYFIYLY